ncbi:MAG: hypothetical protein R3C15_20815 [Thermoleophilia bacterium]
MGIASDRPQRRPGNGWLLRRAAAGGLVAGGATVLFAPGTEAAVFQVTSTADTAGPGTLRDAITSANASPGADEITFASSVTGTLTLNGTQLPTITDDLTITGPGAGVLTIDGASASRIFEAFNGSAVLDVAITDLTLTHGSAAGGAPSSAPVSS